MKISSSSFGNKEAIPSRFSCDGADVNPELHIAQVPDGTQSLALIVDDPDAPGKTWLHWLVYDILPTARIAEDSLPGTEGRNDFGRTGWGGPCPPSGTHRYFFRLYALDAKTALSAGASRKELESAMEGHILESAELVGLYKRE